ncbi:MAG: HlyD family efflux transporter periplasmic adaptor subunit [Ardenticatenaceae bacterium]|nr:HlyD family efflux transporter periplasmic adaptor subunit [Ardenticatenaceae bacterium]
MLKSAKLLWIIVIFSGLVLMGCAQGGAVAENDQADLESAAVESDGGDVAQDENEPENEPVFSQPSLTILADGEIRNGRPALPLGFETSGKLITLNVQPGDTVAEGDVIAVLEDDALRDSVTSAELRLTQSQNSLSQAEAELDRLLTWEPDESAIAIAEANIASAETNVANARSQDAASGSSLTQAQISIDQAERELADAQEDYDNAFSPGREWEVFYDEPICDPGEPEPCFGITWAERIKNDRDFATVRLQNAQDQLRIAEANYSVEAARVSGNSAVNAQASLVASQQELERALKGPTDAEIAAAELNVEQAELVLEQDQFSLEQAQEALSQAELIAPWDGTVLAVDVTTGAFIAAGSPVVTLLDTNRMEFHTTNLSERDLAQVEIGQAAEVTLKSYPNDPINGTVMRIGLQASGVIGDAAVFPVVIAVESGEQIVRTGMTGQAEILRDN